MASLTYMDMESSALYQNPKPTTIDLVGGIYCHICHTKYANKREYDTHYVKHETGGKDTIYTCVICHKEIASYPSFRGHCYTNHVIKERFKCKHCSKLFSKSPALKEHINVMHRFKCSSCKKEFTSKKELQLHQIIHNNTDMPPFKCQACYDKIDTVEGCKDHIDLHSASIYFCPICNENISSRDNAKEHLKKHFPDDGNEQPTSVIIYDKGENYIEQLGGISCKYCSLTHKNRVEFDAHFSYYHGNEDIIYTCNLCGKQYEKYSAFSDHSYNHFTKGRFCCDICHKTFNRLSLLVTHMSACQANVESNGKPFACQQCGNRYTTEMRLREHLRDAHAIHCVVCPEAGCQMIFSTPKDLINHQRERHSKHCWCRQCGLLFPTLQSCERHLDFHKKKLYVCPVCSRNYSEKCLILKHVPQHFESVLHICKVCGKVYNAKNRLIEHIKTHSETKSHTCTYCGKGFVKIGHLQQHLNIHTGSKPYKCPICAKSFASHPNWHKHMRRMHETDSKMIKKEADILSTVMHDSEFESTRTLDEVESPTDIGPKETNSNESMTEIPLEEIDILASAGLDIDFPEAYMLQDPVDSMVESDSIDQMIEYKDIEMLKDVNNENIFESINVILNNNSTLVSEAAAGPPAEYGPELYAPEPLAHIDPNLTVAPKRLPIAVPWEEPWTEPWVEPWEPHVTRVFDEAASRLSLLNTDIF